MGSDDVFLSKYDTDGTLKWTRQLGTRFVDIGFGVSADGVDGVYITGITNGALEVGANVGVTIPDAFLSRYDADGTLQWTRQFGTDGEDIGFGVSADGLGSVYVAGRTEGDLAGLHAGGRWDAFLSKYDATGTLLWSRQYGTSGSDVGDGVFADGLGNVYISGATDGSLHGPNAGESDAFVRKYDANGTHQWTRQFGTIGSESGGGPSVDGIGNIYISGTTRGDLGGPNEGEADAYVRKYDANGMHEWTRQLGTGSIEFHVDVSADGLGGVYITGSTEGSLGGPNAGFDDAFISKFDGSGGFQWTRQLSTSSGDLSYGIATDGEGNAYITGATWGELGGPNPSGEFDAFVAKFTSGFTELPACDFDENLACDIADVDLLVTAIVRGTDVSVFDVTNDGMLNNDDLSHWLSDAASENGFTAPYLMGDANLDGTVNASDLNMLGIRWQQEEALWSAGDFNADGTVNAGDLNKLGLSWQMSIPTAASAESVPEPAAITLLLGIITTPLLRHRFCFFS